MKRSYEERVQLGKHAHKHTGHKPNRIDIGLHKTKRHAVNENQNHLTTNEMLEELERNIDEAMMDYWYDEERFFNLADL